MSESAPEPKPRMALRASLFAILFVLALGVGAGIFGGVAETLTGAVGILAVAVMVANGVAFVAAGLLTLLTYRVRPLDYLPLGPIGTTGWLAGALLGIGTALFNLTLTTRLLPLFDLGYAEMMEQTFESITALITIAGTWALAGLMIPVCEELLFRGVIQRSLQVRFGARTAVVVAAIIFGAFHVHPVHALIAFGLGVVAGTAMVVTRSVWAAVAVHVANNTFAISISLIDSELEHAPMWMLAPAAIALVAGATLLRQSRPAATA